jgi:serine/threonine-protein phosphatase CPPED1
MAGGYGDVRAQDHVWLPPTGPARPWSRPDQLRQPRPGFTFGLLSDRTGLARPGVFERAVEVLNWLRPAFVIQIGDLIEGYTSDAGEITAQWDEIGTVLSRLEVPLFRVVGNHDVSNEPMRQEWVRRHGLLHYHFRYDDALFLVLDTCDPPQDLSEFGGDGEHELTPERLAELHALREADPESLRRQFEGMADWDSTMPAAISDEQLDYFERALHEHRDARWTFVCMHIPAWQGAGHPALDRLRTVLADRPYTMFAGHIHNYRREVIHGRDHIRLGPTGGAWVRSGDEGNFDHVSLVRVGADGPTVANVVLDGVLGVEGGCYPPRGPRSG